MQKITPFIWFDNQAGEAAEFYASVFSGEIKHRTKMSDTPSGTVEVINIELFGQSFTLMSAGPYFKINPAVSFHVKCKTAEEVDEFWEKLSADGKVLMEIGKYPFSERYGWIQDKYGVSWQLIYFKENVSDQKITPVLMFVGKVCGKTEEAVKFYSSIFKNSRVGNIMHYGPGEGDSEENVKYADFSLEGQKFGAMDSSHKHEFAFNEAISFVVDCKDQEEVDYYWHKLSYVPGSEQCGWLKDKYEVSWQIVPKRLNELLGEDKTGKVTQAMLKMKKIVIKELEEAYEGS